MNDHLLATHSSYLSFCKRLYKPFRDAAIAFVKDDCYAKASALTYYSLLSIVPVLAVLFGIAKGFGFEQALNIEINSRFSEQPELMEKFIQFAYSLLQNVQGGIIAGIGTIILLWSVLGLLCNIESALNAIWKTPSSRSLRRRISDYLATMMICPLFLVSSSSINVFLSTQIASAEYDNFVFDAISPFLSLVLKLFPYFLTWILFSFIYLFMPNTKVHMRSALIAGILGGSAFQIWQWIYIKFQIGVSSYGAIYGSFAALPLFLFWLQISWLILLTGAEIAFALENNQFICYRKTISLSDKAAALLMTYRSIEAFTLGKNLPTVRAFSEELGISLSHSHYLLGILQKEGILSIVYYQGKVLGYQPARMIESITFSLVCKAIDENTQFLASVHDSPSFQRIQSLLEQRQRAMEKDSLNLLVYPNYIVD